MIMTYFYPCSPNEISIDSDFMNELDQDKAFIAEVKKNGWRMLVQKIEGEVILWTRHKTTINDQLPELRMAFQALPDDTILDGELLFTRRVKGEPDKAYLFDIIMLRGKLVVELPLRERRRLLEATLEESQLFDHPKIELAKQVRVGKKNLYYRSIGDEVCEGIVLKKLESRYLISATKCLQNPYWIKVKKVASHVKVG